MSAYCMLDFEKGVATCMNRHRAYHRQIVGMGTTNDPKIGLSHILL